MNVDEREALQRKHALLSARLDYTRAERDQIEAQLDAAHAAERARARVRRLALVGVGMSVLSVGLSGAALGVSLLREPERVVIREVLHDVATAPMGAATSSCPFELDDVVPARILTSVDDHSALYVDGMLVDRAPRIWSDVGQFDVMLHRHPSRANVIAIEATNVLSIPGRDRGVLADLRIVTEAGEQHVVTDQDWRVVSERPRAGWEAAGYDESDWSEPAIEARQGEAPWGPVFWPGSSALWLWSYDSNVATSDKPGQETVYLRRTFYFDVAGHVVDRPTPCE